MTRTLRPRKSNPSYVSLAGIDFDDNAAGPSKHASAWDEEADSGSDFSPEKDDKNAQAEQDDDEDDDDDEMDAEEEVPEVARSVSRSVSVAQSRRSASVVDSKAKVLRSLSKPTLSRASKRQQYVLPTPS
ncbi:hypothetical protein H0H93_016604, partial [Arthromyces matolae]